MEGTGDTGVVLLIPPKWQRPIWVPSDVSVSPQRRMPEETVAEPWEALTCPFGGVYSEEPYSAMCAPPV